MSKPGILRLKKRKKAPSPSNGKADDSMISKLLGLSWSVQCGELQAALNESVLGFMDWSWMLSAIKAAEQLGQGAQMRSNMGRGSLACGIAEDGEALLSL